MTRATAMPMALPSTPMKSSAFLGEKRSRCSCMSGPRAREMLPVMGRRCIRAAPMMVRSSRCGAAAVMPSDILKVRCRSTSLCKPQRADQSCIHSGGCSASGGARVSSGSAGPPMRMCARSRSCGRTRLFGRDARCRASASGAPVRLAACVTVQTGWMSPCASSDINCLCLSRIARALAPVPVSSTCGATSRGAVRSAISGRADASRGAAWSVVTRHPACATPMPGSVPRTGGPGHSRAPIAALGSVASAEGANARRAVRDATRIARVPLAGSWGRARAAGACASPAASEPAPEATDAY
mmetsp:Transcript_5085/g.15027  ORF Transcript_5085/g.15027 Transcript_5085/m.15027 type:complete len:299 (-) Transcript_5085:743-1639(-)